MRSTKLAGLFIYYFFSIVSVKTKKINLMAALEVKSLGFIICTLFVQNLLYVEIFHMISEHSDAAAEKVMYIVRILGSMNFHTTI